MSTYFLLGRSEVWRSVEKVTGLEQENCWLTGSGRFPFNLIQRSDLDIILIAEQGMFFHKTGKDLARLLPRPELSLSLSTPMIRTRSPRPALACLGTPKITKTDGTSLCRSRVNRRNIHTPLVGVSHEGCSSSAPEWFQQLFSLCALRLLTH